MTTVNTTDDLLRAARENKEFREAFRREILTEELMTAPGDIKELNETAINIAATGEALNERAATTNQQLEIMADGVNSLVRGIADYKSSTDSRLNSLQQITEANAKGIGDLVSGIADMSRNLNEKIEEKVDGVNQKLGGMDEKINEIRASHR